MQKTGVELQAKVRWIKNENTRDDPSADEGKVQRRAQVNVGFLGINWGIKTRSLRFYRIRPLSKALSWLELRTSAKMDGPRDLSDLLAPGQAHAADLPYYYLYNPVHNMSPNGHNWMDPRMGERVEKMSEDFTYASADNIRSWVQEHVIDAGIKPKRVLDVATGTGVNALVYAEMLPDAEVIGIDIAPSLLRWAKKRAADKGLGNVSFYHMNAADLSHYETDGFDWVNEGMVLHEMPPDNVFQTVREMIRSARPAG